MLSRRYRFALELTNATGQPSRISIDSTDGVIVSIVKR